ncbi:hypothetical protein DID80_06005 [Candidatus Marinamargulisbacteria bacterium SCGC AAA071-K20]|nr:hypothetical protein DID80_06005 [Candidatus Marinamargulisbacteria bacterium SCGC AAA071-K20]
MDGINLSRRRSLSMRPQSLDDTSKDKLDSIKDLVNRQTGDNRFSNKDFSDLESKLCDFLKPGTSVPDNKTMLRALNTEIVSTIEDEQVKRDFLDAVIRVFHPKFQSGERGIRFHNDLFVIFGKSILPASTIDSKEARSDQLLATATGDPFSGRRQGTNFQEYSRDLSRIQTERAGIFVPDVASEKLIDLREDFANLRDSKKDHGAKDFARCKQTLKDTIGNMN